MSQTLLLRANRTGHGPLSVAACICKRVGVYIDIACLHTTSAGTERDVHPVLHALGSTGPHSALMRVIWIGGAEERGGNFVHRFETGFSSWALVPFILPHRTYSFNFCGAPQIKPRLVEIPLLSLPLWTFPQTSWVIATSRPTFKGEAFVASLQRQFLIQIPSSGLLLRTEF